MEEKLNNFMKNLSDDDIDLYNKLDNMYGSEINNDILFNILTSNKLLQDEICKIIKEIVYDYKDDIYIETQHLYDIEIIDDKYDFSSGLYNCDCIYTRAINKALSLDYDVEVEKQSGNDMKTKIKEWYIKEYPTDELGVEIDDDVTFEDLFESLDKNVYETLGVGDTIIRERTFDKLAKVMNVEYDYIHEKWLRG